MSKKIEGVLTAIVTTFDDNGDFCATRMRKQVQRQLKNGNSIFCNGTNGEFFVLNEKEKLAVTEVCVDEVAGKAPVMAHIGEISTRETIKLGKQIEKMGVDAVSVITPYFIPVKQEELIYHYTKIADALTVPVFMYNIPARTGNTILPETAAKLGEHPNILGIKDSAGSYESLKGFTDVAKKMSNFNVLTGPDSLIYQGFVDGCVGSISGLANVAPGQINAIWKHFKEGNLEQSKAAQDAVGELRKNLYATVFSPAAVKKALALMGEEVGVSRYPIEFSDSDIAAIKAIVAKL
ncbi:dihydrodipicolinate synthase family protein [Zophobihabitans entericus]|uniref:Dihydrodipicolinate synthase family protein n=1 Tax=Zophobihabitans entericus TaxID=1635327 RepID=A0A6G9IC70_9GAMM|nr:dihydrodipicolinate synthase family protein [Zophobihabitans entericus]QIQ21180.1 dihydrodipicolinate synthase family protein [Zophobihabitans entericus]